MLVFVHDGSRVSMINISYWLYRFKVVIWVKDIVFGKLTILFLVNYWDLDYGVYDKSCRVSRVF